MHLTAWFAENHIDWLDSLEIRPSQLGGTGVYSRSAVPADTVLLSVPKAVILSPRTCGISNLLEDIECDPMQKLVLAYIFEKSQPSSPWDAFIASIQEVPLPDVPRLWPESLKELLSHCDIAFSGGLECDQFDEYYKDAAEFFAHLDYPLSKADYTDAILRVSSRAFDVDNYHELALVPGACLFNHSDTNHVQFETDGTVCDLCGSLACGCIGDDSESESEQEQDQDQDADDSDSAESEGDDPNADAASQVSVDTQNICEIRAKVQILANQEIFNTYGQDGNSAMLARYGFVIPENKHEIIDITRDVFQYAKRNSLRDRYSYWKKHLDEFVEQEGVDPHDVLFVSDGQVSEAVVFVCSIFSLSPKEYTKFVRTGEYNLKSEDKVVSILHKILAQRLENYRDADTPSSQYFERAKTLTGREQSICLLIGTEKQLLERALEDVLN